ncbi:response regulator [Paenibacillus segetis]|uniref:Two-component system, response regulator YesN n=1 Tax=Paenibacillus segetis TaxID=1325360 RepID=A0ABQ1Y663_9BACL|nr:response regulator [Paenibacillus segetis]GGH12994.1 hypothetical protein GCM10008013_05730 [Paenibacillus segetis]
MLRVLIVDDEPIVRIALREIIRWDSYGCEIAGEASNGREALRMIGNNNIDLVLVDMQMPIMTGIEFIKELRDTPDGTKIGVIVLSAYRNYEYVRESFLYGVYDYIIKDDLEEEKVGTVIEKAVTMLLERMNESERKESEARSVLQQLKDQRFMEGVRKESGNVRNIRRSPHGEQELEIWNKGLPSYRHIVGSLLIDRSYKESFEDQGQKQRFVMHTVRQVIEGYGYEAVMNMAGPLEYALLILIPRHVSGLAARELLHEIITKAMSHLEQYVNVRGCIGVAEPCEDSGLWGARYEQAFVLAQYRFFNGGGRAYFPEDAAGPSQELRNQHGSNSGSVSAFIQALARDDDQWRKELNILLSHFSLHRKATIDQVLEPYRSLILEMNTLLYSKGIPWSNIKGVEFSASQLLSKIDSLQEVNRNMVEIAEKVAATVFAAKYELDSAERPVEKVRRWIQIHYHEPISLTLASEEAGISETYLSKLFSKEMGETFVEYVTRIRIEKAIGMMYSGMKLYEIGEKVGYPNQGHFTKVFKKVTGLAPAEYREQLHQEVEER